MQIAVAGQTFYVGLLPPYSPTEWLVLKPCVLVRDTGAEELNRAIALYAAEFSMLD